MEDIDPKKITLLPCLPPKRLVQESLPKHGKGDKFLKGPVPWSWLSMAGKISGKGKALHVAITLWFTAGIKNNRTAALSYKVLKEMGVGRNAAYRGLDSLEKAGLVSTNRHRGRCPVITINDCPERNKK